MIRILTLAVALLAAGQAAALSCLRPNVARTFNWHQESADRYTLGIGRVIVPGEVPAYVEGQPREMPARFSGRLMGRRGPGAPVEMPITVRATCIASWCGGFPEGDGALIVYLKATPAGRVLEVGPCPGDLEPTSPAREAMLQRCLQRGACTEAEIARAELG